jgi:DNA polymerase I-like protein with 3'-5' exonuclease and polymerase domains
MKFYKLNGYVETFTGRRRRGPLSPNKVYNSPVQGVTAEIVMEAFCRLSETGDPVLQAELNIHDDLTFLRVPERKVDHYLEKIIDVMIQPPFDFINVPISLEASVGENWLEMEEVGTYASHEWNIDYHKERKCVGYKIAA